MNTRLTAALLLVLLATAASPAQTPLGTAFTYQGQVQLNDITQTPSTSSPEPQNRFRR